MKGIKVPVTFTISPEGLSACVKGYHKKVIASWDRVVSAMITPTDCKAHLYNNPMGFLADQAEGFLKKNAG